MADLLRVLLDLTILSDPHLTRGLGRYVTSLAGKIHELALSSPELEIYAIKEHPTWGVPRVTEDVPSLLEELADRPPVIARGLRFFSDSSRGLDKAAAQCQADVIHFPDPRATPLAQLKTPHVVTCHHLDSKVGPENWHGDRARLSGSKRGKYVAADRVIAISRATAQELIARADIPREKISVVHNGVARRLWSPSGQKESSSRLQALGLGGRRYLLGVGEISQRKNVAGVFEGLARARTLTGKSEIVVAWAGSLSRREKERLRAKAREAGVKDALLCLDYVSDADLAALYQNAVALAFVSHREGFGYPVVEAMAAGCPVIASNRSSLLEVAGHAALLVDPDDSSAIADAIVLLADDNAERHRLAELGMQRAKDFSLSQMAEGTLQAYRAACGR